MDATDRKILRELQKNGRISNQELAERVNLSPSPCLRRVRNLEREGVIRGYTAVIDQERYGLPINVFVLVRLERHGEAQVRAFEQGVQDIDEIIECYLMTGSSDYLLHVICDSLKSYERFMREKLQRIPGISGIETSFALGQVKKSQAFPPVSSFALPPRGTATEV